MDYKKYEFDGYNAHFIKTNRFKSIYISFVLINEFNKENLTKNFILRKLLTTSSKKLKNEVEVTREVSKLYNSGLVVSNDIIGNSIVTTFDMEVLEDRYTEDGLLKKALTYFFDTIFYPNIIDNKFEKENYDLAISSAKLYYESQKENKNKYAVDNAYLLMDEEFLKYDINGYAKDLDNITRENMVTYYNDLIKSANANIFMIGSFDDDNVLKIINKNLDSKVFKNDNYSRSITFTDKPELKEKEDIETNNQSILVMLYKILNATKREKNVIFPIFNRIFGGSDNSKLFKVVREENSLCYDIGSTISRSGVVRVQSGISYENKEKVKKLIDEQLKKMKNGNISDKEFNEAIVFRRRALKQFEDYNDSILYLKEGNVLFESDDIDERMEHLNSVKKEEIIELSKKIVLNVVYMLKGDTDEKD